MFRYLGKLFAIAALALGVSTPVLVAEARADVFATILSKGVVRVGVFADVPPFGYPNANRELEGFDIDLANMVAKALGVKLEMVTVTAPNRIPYLLTDKIDIVIALMGLTPERAKSILFTAPYVNTSLAVYGPKSIAVTSPGAVGTYKISAAKGTSEDLAMSGANPTAVMMRTEDNATAATAYISGQADLIATNSLIAVELAKKNTGKEFDLKFVLKRAPGHMGVKMGEHNLVRWLDSFVFFSTFNGELDRLHRKWLNTPMEPLPSL